MTEGSAHVEELLDRYRTGELGPAERRRVELHLEECGRCRTALASLSAFSRTVERAYEAETAARAAEGEPDWGRLRASIVERVREPAPRRSWLPRHAPQAAAAVVALVALGVLWQQGIRGPDDADRALRSESPVPSRADRGGGRAGGPTADAPAPEASPDRVNDIQPDDARVADREPAAAAETIRRDVDLGEAEGREDETVSRARFGERVDSVVVGAAAEGAPEVAQEAAVTAQKNAAAPTPELERFQRRARTALSEADSVLAAGALAQWRDSLVSGEDLPADLRLAAEALVDSLAALLAGRP